MRRFFKEKKAKAFNLDQSELDQAVDQFLKQGGKINKIQADESDQDKEIQNEYRTRENIGINSLF